MSNDISSSMFEEEPEVIQEAEVSKVNSQDSQEVQETSDTSETVETPITETPVEDAEEVTTEETVEPTENVEPIVEPAQTSTETKVVKDKTYSEKEFKGVLAAKVNEERMRKELQAQLDSLKQEQLKLQTLVSNATTTQIYEGLEQDDPLTYKDLQKLDALKSQKLVEAQNQINNQTVQVTCQMQIQKAKEKYTKETAGEGLTYDEVMSFGEPLNNNELSEIYQAALSGKDAAEIAYQKKIDNNPELKQKQKLQERELIKRELLKELATGKSKDSKQIKQALPQKTILSQPKSIVEQMFG